MVTSKEPISVFNETVNAVARICGKFIVCAVTVNSGGTSLYFNSAPELLHKDKNNEPVSVILNATACCLLYRVIMGACKRSLNGMEVVISAKLPDNFLAHSSHFRRWDLSRRGGRTGTSW